MISYNLSFPNMEDVTQRLLAAVDFSSKSIQLQVLDGDLTLCEVEIFAECWPPMYGDQCEYTCNSSCSDRRCLYDGQCFECQGTAAQNESCPSYVNESFKSERSLAPKMLVYSSLPRKISGNTVGCLVRLFIKTKKALVVQ
ncbi:hypothetical protein Btru_071822 [Bulinus truncatus]|nr:hypothetical protein Btru_071822 [Bulinus truncatus]